MLLLSIIPQILNPVTFDTPVVIERCHRLGKASDKTRPLIAKFLNFKNKEKVLRRAREIKEILFENRRIYIYADCSAETQQKKDVFKAVKKTLREKGIEYSLHHPASLRISHEGAVKWFTSPAEVVDFLSKLEN